MSATPVDPQAALAAPADPASASPDSLLFQSALKSHYLAFFRPVETVGTAVDDMTVINEISRMEDTWCRFEESQIAQDEIPEDGAAFDSWYLTQLDQVRQSDSLVLDYLRGSASREALAHYVLLDTQFSSGFDDVMAYAQTSLPLRCKIAIAKNYWDEIGNGEPTDAHTEVFDQCYNYFAGLIDRSDRFTLPDPPAQTMKKGNIFYAWLRRPKYKPRLLGAIGVDECSAVNRWRGLLDAFERHDVPATAREYQVVHVEVDARHGVDWIENVLHPYVRINRDYLRETSLGILILKRLKLASNELMLALLERVTAAS